MHAGQLVTVLALLCSAFGLTAALEAAFVTGQVRVLWEQTPAVSTAWSAGTAAVLLAATAIVFAGAVLLDRRHAVGRWLVIAGGVAMLVAGIGGPLAIRALPESDAYSGIFAPPRGAHLALVAVAVLACALAPVIGSGHAAGPAPRPRAVTTAAGVLGLVTAGCAIVSMVRYWAGWNGFITYLDLSDWRHYGDLLATTAIAAIVLAGAAAVLLAVGAVAMLLRPPRGRWPLLIGACLVTPATLLPAHDLRIWADWIGAADLVGGALAPTALAWLGGVLLPVAVVVAALLSRPAGTGYSAVGSGPRAAS